MTTERLALVDDLARRHPRPSRLMWSKFPADARQAAAVGIEDDDIDGICWLGAMRAAEKFDPDAGVMFSTYAAYFMRTELNGAVRKRLARKRRAIVTHITDDGFLSGPDVWAEYERESDVRRIIELAETILPPAVRAAVYGHFGVGRRVSEVELCERLKVPARSVQRLKDLGVERLRRAIAADR